MTRIPTFAWLVIFSMSLSAACKTMTGETTGHQLDDTTITTSVKSKLASQDQFSSLTRINVKTVENVVYLTGKVTTAKEKNMAGDIAAHVDGVKKVENNIEVAP